MYLSECDFHFITKKFSLTWRPIDDEDIMPEKKYLISDKQIKFQNKDINVLEKVNGKYRVVATRVVTRDRPYINFEVATNLSASKQKSLLLHRARLISFKGKQPDKPFVRHGQLGQHNNDLENLSWGTHDENMNDVKIDGTLKGEKNASSKITSEQALAIYVLSQLDLITPEILDTLPIGKASVSHIKNKQHWAHIVSSDIESLVGQCKRVLLKQNDQALEKLRIKLEKEHAKELARIKNVIKSTVNNVLADI